MKNTFFCEKKKNEDRWEKKKKLTFVRKEVEQKRKPYLELDPKESSFF